MLLIILPVKNEEKTIKATAQEVAKFCVKNFISYKIAFVDDRSTDSTWEILSSLKIKNMILIKNEFDGGKGSALKAGYIMAKERLDTQNREDNALDKINQWEKDHEEVKHV